MLNYIIYIVVFFILAFVIIITFKTINIGLKFKKKKEKKKILYWRKNYNTENNLTLLD